MGFFLKCVCLGAVMLSFCLPAFAQVAPGRGIAMPGQTASERLAYTAWWILPEVLEACRLAPDVCDLDAQQKKFLADVLALFPQAHKTVMLDFVSEKLNPGLFEAGHGPHRLAVTEQLPGVPIRLNSDVLETENPEMFTLVSIFAHEMGHQAGYSDTSEALLDQFGNKIAKLFVRNSQVTTAVSLGYPDVQLVLFEKILDPFSFAKLGSSHVDVFPNLIAVDPHQILVLNQTLDFALDCGYGGTVYQLWISNLHWTGVVDLPSINDHRLAAELTEKHYCEYSTKGTWITSSQRIHLGLDPVVPSGAPAVSPRLSGDTGVFPTGIDGLEFDRGMFISPLIAQILTDVPTADITAIKTNTDHLKSGDPYLVEIDFELASADPKILKMPMIDCNLVMTSDDFKSRYSSGEPYAFSVADHACKLTSKGALPGRLKYHASLRAKFPKEAPARSYFVKALALDFKDRQSFAKPQSRTSVVIDALSPAAGPDAKVVEVRIRLHDGQESSLQNPQPLKYVWCQKFDLVVTTDAPMKDAAHPSSSNQIQQAHLWYRISYRNPTRPSAVIVERTDFNPYGGWSTRTSSVNEGTEFKTTMDIKQEFLGPDEFDTIDLVRMTVMTNDLREHVIDLQNGFELKSIYNPGLGCE